MDENSSRLKSTTNLKIKIFIIFMFTSITSNFPDTYYSLFFVHSGEWTLADRKIILKDNFLISNYS